MQGYLSKPNKTLGSKQRFFVLDDSTLVYYDTEAKVQKLAEIFLSVHSSVSRTGDHEISIDNITVGTKISTRTSFVLSCGDPTDCDRWVEALQNACELASPDTKYQTLYGIVSQQTGDLISLKLKKNKVVELTFEGTEIPENIGVAMASSLRLNSSLKKLSIRIQMNGARTHELGEVVGLALASALEKHTGINELHLGCCSFTNQTGLAIASAIAKNPSVKKFSMYNCKNIDDQTLALMVAALEKNVGLEELSLSEMLLGDEAGLAISNMLSRNQTLLNMTITQGDNKRASSPPPTMTDQLFLRLLLHCTRTPLCKFFS